MQPTELCDLCRQALAWDCVVDRHIFNQIQQERQKLDTNAGKLDAVSRQLLVHMMEQINEKFDITFISDSFKALKNRKYMSNTTIE